MKVSLVLLTHNRSNSVIQSLSANLKSAGYPLHEIVHVDNASVGQLGVEWITANAQPSVQVLHTENLGVAKGYNRGMLLATGSHIVITGCDRIMPDNWLKQMVRAAKAIPETGVISCYSRPSAAFLLDRFESRYLGEPFEQAGIHLRPAHVAEARFHSRDFLLKAGFFREDFGLYGYEDVEWAERAARVARQYGLRNYVLTNMDHAFHLDDADGGANYQVFKREQNAEPYKKALAQRCWELGSPYYNPYSRIEAPILDAQPLPPCGVP